jgi:hypothetical protein
MESISRDTMACYTYPRSPDEVDQLFRHLRGLGIKHIIIKCMDINKAGEIILKEKLLRAVMESRYKPPFLTLMVNVSNRANLDMPHLVENIAAAIGRSMTTFHYQPAGISIDAEPLIGRDRDTHLIDYNIIEFHTKLTRAINALPTPNRMPLAVSMYISPAHLSREDVIPMLSPLFDAIRGGCADNFIAIPAYTSPDICREDNLVDSAQLLTQHGIPFKFIIATMYERLEDRLRFLSTNITRERCPLFRGYMLYQERHTEAIESLTVSPTEGLDLLLQYGASFYE